MHLSSMQKKRKNISYKKERHLTVTFHVDVQALFEPTRLTLVPSGDVHHAIVVLLAHVFQVSNKTKHVKES